MSRESSVVSLKKKSYRDLIVWQKSILLAKHIYDVTETFPKREHFGLAAQIRKSAVSIASNIAEGASRHTDKDYAHFLIIARGSTAELVTQLTIAHMCNLINDENLENLMLQGDEISKMLSSLRSRLTTND